MVEEERLRKLGFRIHAAITLARPHLEKKGLVGRIVGMVSQSTQVTALRLQRKLEWKNPDGNSGNFQKFSRLMVGLFLGMEMEIGFCTAQKYPGSIWV